MAKKKPEGYLSAKESRKISRENRKITNAFEKKKKRKNVPESEYLIFIHFSLLMSVRLRLLTVLILMFRSGKQSVLSVNPVAANRLQVYPLCSFFNVLRDRLSRAKFV